MPDEPNKKMDELLRSYAEERRKAADVSLHPATRQMLQGEVARVFGGNPTARPWWQRLRAFWPQIAFAGGLCMVFGIAVLSLRQPDRARDSETPAAAKETVAEKIDAAGKDQALPKLEAQEADQRSAAGVALTDFPQVAEPAKNETPRPEKRSESLFRERTLAETPPSDRSVAVEQKQRSDALADESRLQKRTGQSAASSAPAQTEAETLLQKKESFFGDLSVGTTTQSKTAESASAQDKPAEPSILRATRAPSPTSAAPRAMSSSALTNLGAARRLNFVSAPDVADVKLGTVLTAGRPILNNFQVEQTGTNVRFYDADGSVYLGAMQPTNIDTTAAGDTVTLQLDRSTLANSAAYFFSVQGTNQTLRSDVVLTGQYFTQTNLQPSSLDSFAIAPEAKAAQQTPPRHLIIGNATVGQTSQVPVRAISNQP